VVHYKDPGLVTWHNTAVAIWVHYTRFSSRLHQYKKHNPFFYVKVFVFGMQ